MRILYTATERLQILSVEHFLPIVLAVVIAVFLIQYAKEISIKKQQKLVHYLAPFMPLSVVAFHLYCVLEADYSIQTDLPL